jgi:SHS2 domain-containing protein
MPYRPLAHTADIGFEVLAPTLAELFSEAVPAFTHSFTDVERVEERLRREFALSAADRELLLHDWLEELLFAFESERLLFRRAQARLAAAAVGELRLEATAWGEVHDPARHPLKVLLKAVTYHRLAVEESEDGWRARVILDI